MSLSPVVAAALGGPPLGVTAEVINPNLLLKSEAFNDAAWTKSSATVTANATTDPLGGTTADEVAFSTGSGSVAQTTTIAAASGGVSGVQTPTSTWQRFSVTATLDVGTYTFSAWLLDPSDNAFGVRMRIDVSGGFVRCAFTDVGDLADVFAWGAKLETGASVTGAAATYGAT